MTAWLMAKPLEEMRVSKKKYSGGKKKKVIQSGICANVVTNYT